ncbi:hypothetical protein, partial [Bombilactobacillus bombi]|uniref:hypothetical protein n=1 Tax=Bombilactobacillus bombi TaxID=1303590 RepID=UPI001C63029E
MVTSNNNNKLTKLGTILIMVFKCLFLFLTLFTIISVLIVKKQYILFGIVIFIALTILAVAGSKINTLPHFSLFIFLFTLFLGIITIWLLKTPIESDFNVQYLAAKALKNGNFIFQNNSYFERWPYQLGLSIYESWLLRLVNSSNFLRFFNVITIAGITVLIYQIAQKITTEPAARLAALLYSIFLTPLTYCAVLT